MINWPELFGPGSGSDFGFHLLIRVVTNGVGKCRYVFVIPSHVNLNTAINSTGNLTVH